MKKLLHIVLFFLLIISSSYSQTERNLKQNPLKISEYVTDETGTLKSEEIDFLRLKLRKFYDSTSTQIVVLLISSLNGESIEESANSIFRHNGIGGKDKNNGVLILISKEERKIRIEVGYGLEGAITDAASKMIISREMTPELKNGNYFKGIDNAVNKIISLSTYEFSNSINKSKGNGISWSFIIALALPLSIIVIAIVVIVRNRNKGITDYGSGASNYYTDSGSSSFWSGGSDSSSGSDSGFSGDGGDSGGGGASGDY